MPIFTAAEPTPQSLSRRFHKLRRVFDIDHIQRQPLDAPSVVQYYEDSHDAYRKYHSAEGAVHMALNDGDRFHADGFYGQVRLLDAAWRQRPPQDVLELLADVAVRTDGALHAEKYFATATEDCAAARPAHRWRHLVALARVSASEAGQPAPGLDAARALLEV